jgi:predicted small secreted protein
MYAILLNSQKKDATMKKLTVLLTLTMVFLSLTACNTIQGIGKDVKKAGEVVESAGKK